MYSTKINVLETVALLKAQGISDVVLSPGSRNAPLILSFAADAAFRCHSVVDERSAGFFALGLILATKRPVVVCCTSGTALLNYGPAVAEAFYQNLPLIVLSADRSPAWIGQMDGQTIPQPGVFGALVRLSVQLTESVTDEDSWRNNRLLNEAVNACRAFGQGPVHINIPISEPFSDYSAVALPAVRCIRSVEADSSALCCDGTTSVATDLPALDGVASVAADSPLRRMAKVLLKSAYPMMIVGQRMPMDDDLAEIVERLSIDFGVVVLAEHLSNIRGKHVLGSFDALLAVDAIQLAKPFQVSEALPAPDFVLTLGGHIVSKRLKQFIRSNKPEQHWHLTSNTDSPDLYQSLTDVVCGDPVNNLRLLIKLLLEIKQYNIHIENALDNKNTMDSERIRVSNCQHWSSRAWTMPTDQTTFPIGLIEALPFSDLKVTGCLAQHLPQAAVLFLGNSSTVRNMQLFGLPNNCKVFCNRGTNGIEGSLSTACGYASVTNELVFIELGDLSFFYDLNILTLKPFPSNLRILIPNNGGGGIFHALKTAEPTEVHSRYVAAAHANEAKDWAKAAGLKYLRVGGGDLEEDVSGTYWTEQDLSDAVAELVLPDWGKAVLLEIITPIDNGTDAWYSYLSNIDN
jgi:2-succinyl-5-enolpyruvyl-6-hydroxy-3-cyclohexene-1-carboxylate synthase